jgi:hypothetical protein
VTAVERALARLGVTTEADLEVLDDAGWALLEAAAATDDAYEAWLAHVGACVSCRPQRWCELGCLLAQAYTAAWQKMHPPVPGSAWGRCISCGALTPLVAAGAWACAGHGGRPVPEVAG